MGSYKALRYTNHFTGNAVLTVRLFVILQLYISEDIFVRILENTENLELRFYNEQLYHLYFSLNIVAKIK
jgi:hypothetical protein